MTSKGDWQCLSTSKRHYWIWLSFSWLLFRKIICLKIENKNRWDKSSQNSHITTSEQYLCSALVLIIDFKATFHLTISMRGQRSTGKIQRNNCHHGICGSSLTGKTSSVSSSSRTGRIGMSKIVEWEVALTRLSTDHYFSTGVGIPVLVN